MVDIRAVFAFSHLVFFLLCATVATSPVTANDKGDGSREDIVIAPLSNDGAEEASEADIANFIHSLDNQFNSHFQDDELENSSTVPATDVTSEPAEKSSEASRVSSQPRETSVEKVEHEIDVMTVLIIGVTAAGLLVVLSIVVVVVVVCRRKGTKDFSLNKDVHTWDPQVLHPQILRPSKKDIDAFIFGPPIPTVDQMIKQ